MLYKIQWNMLSEVGLRVVLWWLFLYYDYADPFIREIKREELWKYQYPVTPSIVPGYMLWFILFLVPTIVTFVVYCKTKRTEEVVQYWLALHLAYGINGFITSLVKILVGRPRPDFYYRCFPEGSGEDFNNCTGEKSIYLDGRKSFISGHASFAFSCMTFTSLYLAEKLHLFEENRRGQSWQLCVCIAPLIAAAGIAISRTCDYHHHYEDVIIGSILGTVISCLCYKQYFPLRNGT